MFSREAALDQTLAGSPTPGPWRINHEGRTWAWITGPGQEHPFAKVCTAQCRARSTDDELLANLRLILRAPELFELAKALAAGNTEIGLLEGAAKDLIAGVEG